MGSTSATAFNSPNLARVARDEARLQALRRYRILDTEPEPGFDRITRLAAHLFEVPTALVNFVAADRQWFKSTVGFEEKQTGLDVSFCVYTVEAGDTFVVEDLSQDERFADNPYVTDDGVRFYAGVPLESESGHCLGTLCVLDTAPRSPSDEALARLADLAAMVEDELELRRQVTEHEAARSTLRQSRELLQHAEELAHVGGWTYDPATEELTWTAETYCIHEIPEDREIDIEAALKFFTPESRPIIESHVEALIEEGREYDLELSIVTAEGRRRRVRTIGTAHEADGEAPRLTGAIQDITERHRAEQLTEMQSTFFEAIAAGTPIEEVLDELCRSVEEQFEASWVSVLRRENERLVHAAGPSLPGGYVERIDGTHIGPGAGTCGTAAFEHRTVITEDIRTDDRWAGVRERAETAGIRSCWSMPIQGEDGDVLGTFAVYGGTPRTPSEADQELMRKMAHVAGVALMRERREQALRRSEEKFRTVVENAQPVVFMVDRDGTFVLSEGADLASLGFESGEVVGESVFDLYADDSEVTEGIRRALDGEQIDNEIEVAGRVFDNWYSPFYDEEGAVAGCIGMAADVTERKEMKEDLREREERLRMAQRIANLGYWTHDLQTGDLVWSPETRRIFGWPEAEAVTYDAFMEAVHPDDRERLRAAQKAALTGEDQLDLEYRIRRPSGEERVLQERGRLQRDEEGRPVSMMGAVLDVTERVQRREALREAKESAEEADRIKSALLSNINHELRTPLTSIISFSELVQENPDLADRFVDRILGGGRRLLYTLNTVMDFAELEGDEHATSPEATQLEAVVRSVMNGFREGARRKGIELTVEVPDGLDSVPLDEHRVERVLTHLLHNAVKFTEEGRVTARVEERSDAVVFRVLDTGIGIEPSFLPRVFDEFAQASTGYDRSYEGNGLGLTVAKRLVEQMDGTIEVDSTPGEGTCVTVCVPRARHAPKVD